MKNMQIKYPNKLKELRVARNLKQKEVAKLLDFKCEDRICRWERGQAMPSVKNLFKLAKIYDTTADQLF